MTYDESTFFIFFRCTSLRNKYSSCQQLNNGTKENLILPLEQNTGNGTKPGNECLHFPLLPKAYSSIFFDIVPTPGLQRTTLTEKSTTKTYFFHFVSHKGTIESCPSSPLFIPAKPEKISVRGTRKHVKECSGGSTDSEEAVVSGIKEKFRRKKRKGQTDQKESKGKTGGKSRGEDEQGGKGSERSTVPEQSEEQAGQKPNHSKTKGKVTKPQTEQLPSNKTSKTVGECWTIPGGFITVKQNEKVKLVFVFLTSTFGFISYKSIKINLLKPNVNITVMIL